jgi:transcriptional regulator with XRE-family HTH domain
MAHPLEHYRKKRGLTQGALAAELGCSPALISHIENGRRHITREYAIDWEQKTSIPREVLMFCGEQPEVTDNVPCG